MGGADHPGFVFAGFLGNKAQERAASVAALAAEPRVVVLLEAPHRIAALADALTALGPRPLTVARELTKQYEEVTTLPAAELPAWLAADGNRLRGEFVVVLHAAAVANDASDETRVLQLLLAELPLKTAVRLASEITGTPRNAVYAKALALKKAD